jgi:hypothetical protein
MGTESLDKDLLNTLSDEERAAISDADDAEIAALKNIAQSDTGDGADPEDDDAADDDEGAAADVEPAATADTAEVAAAPAPAAEKAASPAAADQADDGEPQLVAPYAYKLPDDYEEQVKAHKAAMADLRQRRDSGELSMEEFDAEAEKLSEQGDALRSMRIRADMAEDQRRQYEQAQINNAWSRTLKAAKADGVDYATDKDKHADFDVFIKALANKPENNDKPLTWFFAEAHKRVLAMHGITGKAGARTAAGDPAPTAADRKKAAAAARAPDLSALPKDLSQVPGGQSAADVSGDEFDGLDELDGLELEDAIAKLAARDPNFIGKFTGRLRGNTSTRH